MKKVVIGLLVSMGVWGCSGGVGPQGVHVGNGAQAYSSGFGFILSYDPSLTLTEEEEGRKVTLDNRQQAATETSALKLQIDDKPEIKSFEMLEDVAKREGPSNQFVEVKAGALRAWLHEEKTTAQLKRIYYTLIKPGLILKGTLNAFQKGDGIGLLSPVMDTLGLDTKPPQEVDYHWSNPRPVDGETINLHVKATDDVSGVASFHLTLWFWHEGTGAVPGAIGPGTLYFDFKIPRTQKGPDFVLPVTIPKYLRPGSYLVTVHVKDHAENGNHFGADPDKIVDKDYSSKLPATLVVKNVNGIDSKGPEVTDVQLPARLAPGKMNEIEFEVSDNLSGLAGTANIMLRHPLGYTDNPISDSGRLEPTGRPNRYVLRFYVGNYVAPGEYQLDSFSISDKIGNAANSWNFREKRTGVRPEDVQAEIPRMEKLEVLDAKIHPGETVRVRVTLDRPLRDPEILATIHFVPADAVNDKAWNRYSLYLSDLKLPKKGDGRVFEIEVPTHEWQRRCEYVMDSISIGPSYGKLSDFLYFTSHMPTEFAPERKAKFGHPSFQIN